MVQAKTEALLASTLWRRLVSRNLEGCTDSPDAEIGNIRSKVNAGGTPDDWNACAEQ